MGDARSAGADASCLIICDGSPATLVAVWREAVCRPGGGDGELLKPLMWSPVGLTPAAGGANDRIAQAAGLDGVVTGGLAAATEGLSASALLMAAGEEAAKRGIGRVVWPVQFGPGNDEQRIGWIADAFDRALLAARLLSVDTRRASGLNIVVHTPLAELSDTQLMELAADLDAPVGLSWWCERQRANASAASEVCGQCGACVRWSAAMRGAGIVAPVAGLPASVLEDKPAVHEPV
ncbi:MAG: 7-cyano-7-deazaguanine synthase [Phycisphaerales bacterium]